MKQQENFYNAFFAQYIIVAASCIRKLKCLLMQASVVAAPLMGSYVQNVIRMSLPREGKSRGGTSSTF